MGSDALISESSSDQRRPSGCFSSNSNAFAFIRSVTLDDCILGFGVFTILELFIFILINILLKAALGHLLESFSFHWTPFKLIQLEFFEEKHMLLLFGGFGKPLYAANLASIWIRI